MAGPLTGMRVVEVGHIMAGPTCGLMLADLGADVIKVEKIPGGDDIRRAVPPAIDDVSAAFLMMNRNKRGIAIDLKSTSGREIFLRLAAAADVVVENQRTGTMDRLGIGYETLKSVNPALIYCAISGFGQTGPYADRGGFDLIAQGMSGLMSITGEGDGRPPVKVGAPMTDITAGVLAAMGVLAAYTHRLKTGEGQMIDTSLFEAGIIHTYWQSAICFATGVSPGPMGSAHPLMAPYQAFETADGWVTIGAANQTNWKRLLEVLGAEALDEDPRFAENAGRMENLPKLVELLTDYFRQRTTADWLERLREAGLPAGPVLDIGQMHEDPQTIAREMVTSSVHRRLGEVKSIGSPVKFTRTPSEIARPAPDFGEHTREVLGELGYSNEEIGHFAAEGAIDTGLPSDGLVSPQD
ncbi:MAG: CoA transferase [Alphaproteobacteria bacterium]|nr:CoA transferase [Alphaproteobacteria bacterium]